MSDRTAGYDATRIEVLQGWEAIRKRPGMYVGSTGQRGLHQAVFEVSDRAVDEVLAGRAGSVGVTLTSDGGVRVTDDGPGVTIEAAGDPRHAGRPGLETLLTRVNTGTEPHSALATTLARYPAGPAVTNALSSRLTAEVQRDGVRWVQEYSGGVAAAPPVATGPANGSGTSITFHPDAGIFSTTEVSCAVLAQRFRELAFLNRGLDITLTDERSPGEPRTEHFRFEGGVTDFVTLLDTEAVTPALRDVIAFERTDPRAAVTMEVALRWCGSHEERVLTFVNSRPTPEGGEHADGFRAGTAAAVNAYARERRLLTAADPDLSTDHIGEGLTAVVSVKLECPDFQGATRGRLDGPAISDCVAAAVEEHLSAWLEEQPGRAGAVVGRIVQAARRD
ncbi:DNA gyrase subunit B [Streptomyces sp. NPDC003023]|uniref:DNA gyrase subunit B n=1 Tax=Streptomyces sp. NPDC003023 TaxID=3364675 RepID=UPI003675AB90